MAKDVNLNYVTEEFTLNADVADDGTFTVNYPSGFDLGDFENSGRHFLMLNGSRLEQGKDVTLSFGSGAVTVTNVTGAALVAGTGFMTMYRTGTRAKGLTARAATDTSGGSKVVRVNARDLSLVQVSLGSPVTSDPDGVCTSQSATGAHTLTLNGALVTNGVAVFDVPRNVIIDSGGADTAILTITGEDEYEQPMVEKITLNGATVVAGKKAFKKVTSVTSDGTISNGAFVGHGDVFGLPVRIQRTTDVYQQFEDDAKVGDYGSLSGTVVAGLANNTEGTATTADVRGTWDPSSAANGAVSFDIWLVVDDPTDIGNPQYDG